MTTEINTSDNLRGVRYEIRGQLARRAHEMERQGYEIISMNIGNPGLFAAFGMEKLSVYASLVFFGFLYTPVSMVLSVVLNASSRRHEYEADAYAAETYGKPDAMVAALKRLSADNLSNLTPHPLKVVLGYSHPPVLQRIRALQR